MDSPEQAFRIFLCIPLMLIFASMIVMGARYTREHDTRAGYSISLALFAFASLQYNVSTSDAPLTRGTFFITVACIPACFSIWKGRGHKHGSPRTKG